MFRKTMAFLVSAALICGICACGNASTQESSADALVQTEVISETLIATYADSFEQDV